MNSRRLLYCFLIVFLTGATFVAAMEPAHSQNSDEIARRRAQELVGKLNLDEKIQLVHGQGFPHDNRGGAGIIRGIPRLGIPSLISADAASGVRVEGAGATPLPSFMALAATWDRQISYDYGSLIGRELRTLGFAQGLGGGINIVRDPRNGRSFEYLGEDPVLAGEMISSHIQGVQAQKLIATVKHFALNNQETNRYTGIVSVDERTLREIYLLPFEIAVKTARPGNVMCEYGMVSIDGQTPSKTCENYHLITEVLKNEWGFDGTVQTDWLLSLTDTLKAATAGVDEEQPGSLDDYKFEIVRPPFTIHSYFNQKLRDAVLNGKFSEKALNDKVFRKLYSMIRLGIMDRPPMFGGKINQAAGDQVAQSVAEQSFVLLKNALIDATEKTALPLDTAEINSVAVIGGNADRGVIMGGGPGNAYPRGASPVKCLDETYRPVSNLAYLPGCATWYASSPVDALREQLPKAVVRYVDGRDLKEAVAAAAQADVAIMFATQFETADSDLASLALPDQNADPANQAYDQNQLIAHVAKAAKRSVVVLETGTAVTMPWLDDVHAVLETWYPGVRGGQAIARVLVGLVNPSGKLPISFPRSEADLFRKEISRDEAFIEYGDRLNVGYRWYDRKNINPLFPFGFGLSYTRFTASDLSVHFLPTKLSVAFSLTNEGRREGEETVQIYAQMPISTEEPPQRLIGWIKTKLAPGETKRLEASIEPARLAVWDVKAHRWKIPSGEYAIIVGSSSRDTHAKIAHFEMK